MQSRWSRFFSKVGQGAMAGAVTGGGVSVFLLSTWNGGCPIYVQNAIDNYNCTAVVPERGGCFKTNLINCTDDDLTKKLNQGLEEKETTASMVPLILIVGGALVGALVAGISYALDQVNNEQPIIGPEGVPLLPEPLTAYPAPEQAPYVAQVISEAVVEEELEEEQSGIELTRVLFR